MKNDAFGADPTARERWYLRTPGDIDDERRAAEQAGRDAYAEAIRPFIGYERAFKRYNGGGDPDYWNKVQSAYQYIKSEGR